MRVVLNTERSAEDTEYMTGCSLLKGTQAYQNICDAFLRRVYVKVHRYTLILAKCLLVKTDQNQSHL